MRFVASVVFLLGPGVTGPAFAATEAAGFPQRLPMSQGLTGLLVADLDADGKPEIVAGAGEGLAVLRGTGEVLPGWPLSLRAATDKVRLALSGAPAACDLDGDGKLEIVIAGSDKRLHALRLDGKSMPGFPVLLDGRTRGPSACRGKGRSAEIVVVTEAGSLTLVAATGGVPKVLARVSEGVESGVALAALDKGGLSYVFGGGDGTLTVVAPSGKVRAGFPYKMAFRAAGVPAIGDIDDDGQADLVVGSQDFKVHAVDLSGKALKGFPVDTGYRIYSGVALADIDGDGVLDVVVGSANGKVFAIAGNGVVLPGFPAVLEGRVSAAPVVGDLNRDGRQDIVAVTDTAGVVALDPNGKMLSGFPAALDGKANIAAALADLDGDGVPEVVAQAPSGMLHAFKQTDLGKAEKALLAWPLEGHDAEHSGRFGPNAPRLKNLSLTVAVPRTTDPLGVKYDFFDLDGDAEGDTQIRWFLGGKHQTDLDNKRVVPAERTQKHEKWSYTLQDAENFRSYGEKGQLSRIVRSREVEVQNTPPAAPAISLTPKSPRTTETLAVAVTTPSVDPDGDRVEYRHFWLQDGKPFAAPLTTTSIDPKSTKKRETWRAVVVPFDGEVEGASSEAAVTVINTPPGAPVIALVPVRGGKDVAADAKVSGPPHARIDDVVEVRILTHAPDDDRDSISYRYLYKVSGQALELPSGRGRIPARLLRKHDKVEVTVIAVDDQEDGGVVKAELVVDNTPPPAPKLAIAPAAPRTADDLRVAIVEQTADTDFDTVTYRHAWKRNGAAVEHPTVVPASATSRGDQFELTVTPFDGEHEGPAVTVSSRIDNTPPTAPLVVLDDYAPATDATVKPLIQIAATDDDGDALTLKYRWFRDGKPPGLPESTTELAAALTQKNQRWRLQVVAHDGQIDGAAAELELRIRNTPPSAPVIALSAAAPTTRDTQTVKIITPATDIDGDALSYRYRWLRNGVAFDTWPNTKAQLAPGEARKGERWRVEVAAFDGEVAGPSSGLEFRVGNHRPEPPTVALVPSSGAASAPVASRAAVAATPTQANPPGPLVTTVPTTTDLECRVLQPARDPDGDSLLVQTRWFRDGEALVTDPSQRILPASMSREKHRLRCEVVVGDGSVWIEPVSSGELTVVNTPPSAPQLSIIPDKPGTSDALSCELSTPATDADLDVVRYTYSWLVDGKPLPAAGDAPNRVPAKVTQRGQSFTCEVVASDGKADSPKGRAVSRIVNTPPGAPVVSLTPARPAAGQGLVCQIATAASDADGDVLTYDFTWFKDGVQQTFATTSTDVPGRLVRGGDMWRCEVTARDAESRGPNGRSADIVVAR